MNAHLDTNLHVPSSRSSAKVKVKYQGHVSQKMGVLGALVFHKHILFNGETYPHDLEFKNPCRRRPLKTLCGKSKMFFFSHNVFCIHMKDKFHHLNTFNSLPHNPNF